MATLEEYEAASKRNKERRASELKTIENNQRAILERDWGDCREAYFSMKKRFHAPYAMIEANKRDILCGSKITYTQALAAYFYAAEPPATLWNHMKRRADYMGSRMGELFSIDYCERYEDKLKTLVNDAIEIRCALQKTHAYITDLERDWGEHCDLAESIGVRLMPQAQAKVDIESYGDGWALYVEFSVEETVIHRSNDQKLIAPTKFRVQMRTSPSGDVAYHGVQASKVAIFGSHSINPHITAGAGGHCCLGGYSYGVAACSQTNDWAQAMKMLWDYHSDYNGTDEWGRYIRDNTNVYYVDTSEGRKMMLGAEHKTSIGEVLGHDTTRKFYSTSKKLYDQKDYVKCHQTGKIIKRENAHRVTVYLSNEAVMKPSLMVKGLVGKNWYDRERLSNQTERAWAEKRKRIMPALIEEAKTFEKLCDEQAKIAARRRLNGDETLAEAPINVFNCGGTLTFT